LQEHWEAIEFRKAAAETRAIWVEGNEYLQRAAPWATIKEDPARAAASIRFGLNLARLYAIVSRPFLPDASDEILRALGIEDQALDWPGDLEAALSALPAGHAFEVPENLFSKITDAAREEMAARFSGAAAA
jgi:methionyl-tRNA synthetase